MTAECMEVRLKTMLCKLMTRGFRIKKQILLQIQKVFHHFLTDLTNKDLEKIRKITHFNCRIYC